MRFGECDLRCRWCDSPGTWRRARECRIETAPGSGRFRTQPNPVSLDEIEAVLEAWRLPARSLVSLTGGEPLLQPAAVAGLAQRLRARGLRSYLETHGQAVDALARVAEHIDIVSMDWKLEADVEVAEGGPARDFDALHRRFLALARRHCEVVVKIVLSDRTHSEELAAVARHLAEAAPEVPLILQPVTPVGRVSETPDAASLLDWLRTCEALHADVRLIPQTHVAYGAL